MDGRTAQRENRRDPLTIDQVRCASSSDTVELAAISADLPPGAHDVAVAHPAPVLFRGTLIEARFDSEPPDTIQLDRVLLWPRERVPLLLPAGKIRIQQYFEGGGAPRTLVLDVE